jgi:CheY-like chemotaxis protein/MinD-like ATPase involved in chromosome partitioning or flagellar assembly
MLDFEKTSKGRVMAEKILVIDDDLDTLRLVGLMLQRQGYQISAATNGQQGLDKAIEEKPNLILLDIMMPDMDGYEVARRLRKNPTTINIPILMFTAKTQLDDKVAGFEVGADDYLTKPTHPSELQSHVKALLARSAKPVGDSIVDQDQQTGYVIGLIAARGGMGVSALASNLAASLYKKFQTDVILAELTPGQGSLALDLGVPNENGLADILSMAPAEITNESVSDQMVTHAAGFKVLAASNHPRDFQLVNQVTQYENLVGRMAALGQFIVLDIGMGLPPFVQRLLPKINELVVIIEGVPNTINHTRALIDDLIELGIDKNHIAVVLNNRVRTESQIAWAEVQKQLGHSIAATLTPAPELFLQASRLKTPAVLCQPESLTAQQITKLVDRIAEHQAQEKEK